MANRSGMGPGLAITIGLLSVTTVGLFVSTVIFAAEARKQEGFTRDAQTNLQEALGPSGRDARWESVRERSGQQGVVPFLADQNEDLIRLIGGRPSSDDAESLRTQVADKFGESTPNLMAYATNLNARIEAAKREVAAAQSATQTAQRDRDTAFAERESIRDNADDTRARLEGEIDALRAEVQAYADTVASTRNNIEQTLADREASYDATVAEFTSENRDLEDELAQLQEQLRRLAGETRDDRLKPQSEASLVDAKVVNINENTGEVYIDKGQADNVVLGMTFEIYGRGVSIRPNERGDYPDGKATIEITRIETGTSVGRVLNAARGNPILRNDRCVNAVWDPNKEYRFIVFGNFDTNFDGSATPAEADEIRAIIAEWGGIIEDELTGSTDFVVLGRRPILPPEPRPDDPFAVVDIYITKRDIVDRYNQLFEDAGERSIPVLNQNRLYTLTGLDVRPE